jgi:hypothetical protein
VKGSACRARILGRARCQASKAATKLLGLWGVEGDVDGGLVVSKGWGRELGKTELAWGFPKALDELGGLDNGKELSFGGAVCDGVDLARGSSSCVGRVRIIRKRKNENAHNLWDLGIVVEN